MLTLHHAISQVEDKQKAGSKKVSLDNKKTKIRIKNHNLGLVKSNLKTITVKTTKNKVKEITVLYHKKSIIISK